MKTSHRMSLLALQFLLFVAPFDSRATEAASSGPYARWKRGPSSDETYFPIAVWLQSPRNAERFKAAGINLYVGLWRGPNAEQLAALAGANMPVICAQNSYALTQKDNPIIVGWMHNDEPDNAQAQGEGRGWDRRSCRRKSSPISNGCAPPIPRGGLPEPRPGCRLR